MPRPTGFCAAAVLLLAACAPPAQKEWENAATTHICTAEQFQRVTFEADWCNKNTSYFSSYCLGSAFIRNCTPRGVKP